MLRKTLGSLYGGTASMIEEGGGDGDAAVPGAGGEFYPYVSVSVETSPVVV